MQLANKLSKIRKALFKFLYDYNEPEPRKRAKITVSITDDCRNTVCLFDLCIVTLESNKNF